ncbi:hypothetical protein LPJ64_000217 [Coemansia asiatica]|uniref:P-loop containing nucleoside triphosphate hydrolase protein n=1 Tax=Coemansia asiatica TaxID=1052880 RepID=A0A9W7XRC5_9FUNG|nr:hypothetical protein LPJ64_000217 [Coemansia asiatica]
MSAVLSSLDKTRRAKAIHSSISARIQHTGDFILRKLAQKRKINQSPLVVGINGAQGSGKTTLVRGLVDFLTARKISTVGFSLDDLYLPNHEQKELARDRRDNPLLRFRGQPGTQDVGLGRNTLLSLLANTAPTAIPSYDKSLNSGYGDRLAKDQWPVAQPPIDVVLFEGWCLGFRPLDPQEFQSFLQNVHGESNLYKYSRKYTDANLADINAGLGVFEKQLYDLIDAWIFMRVSDIDVVYRWRKDQEDQLAESGRPSLSDQQLEDFVSRFMPAYELALSKLDMHGFVSSGILSNGTLRMHLDMDRNVAAYDHKL